MMELPYRGGRPVCYNAYGVFRDHAVYDRVLGDAEKLGRFLRWRLQVMERGVRMLQLRPCGVNAITQVTDLKSLFFFLYPQKKLLCEGNCIRSFVTKSEQEKRRMVQSIYKEQRPFVSKEIYSEADYLGLNKLVLDDIIWVDDINGLLAATDYIEGCKIFGVDCEWKPNYEKGSKPNKVSIMQIASENRAFIFDLIKLYEDEPKLLDSCFRRILCSSNVLKLGYNLQCDLQQLSQSYGELECFRSYEMLLDIQKFFKEPTGGLSGLSKKILGAGLNKTRRNSNWEQRPLSQYQKEYAALDAALEFGVPGFELWRKLMKFKCFGYFRRAVFKELKATARWMDLVCISPVMADHVITLKVSLNLLAAESQLFQQHADFKFVSPC